MVIVQHT